MASFLNGPTLSSRSFEIFENDKGDDFACEGWLLIKKQSKSGWKKRYCKIYKDEKTLSLYDGKSIFLVFNICWAEKAAEACGMA